MIELYILLLLTVLLPTEFFIVMSERAFFPNTRFHSEDFKRHANRIVGGMPTNISKFPFQVAIFVREPYRVMQCGGTIISDVKIVTAAHCMTNEAGEAVMPQNTIVKAGDAKITSENMKKLYVSTVTVHPSYDKETYNNDIAVVTVNQSIQFNEFMSSIPLRMDTPNDNDNCSVSGWGYTDSSTRMPSDILLYTPVSIINHGSCEYSYEAISDISPSMICAQRLDYPGDSCQGDSGGPLVCDDKLTGIVSWGYKCGEPDFPGVYTNIAMYNDWLRTLSIPSKSSFSFNYSYILIYQIILVAYINFIQKLVQNLI